MEVGGPQPVRQAVFEGDAHRLEPEDLVHRVLSQPLRLEREQVDVPAPAAGRSQAHLDDAVVNDYAVGLVRRSPNAVTSSSTAKKCGLTSSLHGPIVSYSARRSTTSAGSRLGLSFLPTGGQDQGSADRRRAMAVTVLGRGSGMVSVSATIIASRPIARPGGESSGGADSDRM